MNAKPVLQLPSELVDQIAAGEVVERPASMAKELVENAIDAASTHVRVAFQDGGVAELSVSDNGHGMLPADVEMAFKRHATSKIATLEDLTSVHSFGFRGEALASIASVSRTTVASRTELADSGTALSVHGGAVQQAAPVGMARGTTVTVKDLFYNVPARRKFLKSTATESGHIADVVTALALASPHVHVELWRDGRANINLPSCDDLGARARQVFEGRMLMPIAADRGPLQLAAWLCESAATHPRDLWIFVNARWVKDRVLARAVSDAMRARLPAGTYPAGVVHVRIDPSLVDVNVHPQKTEVRFVDPRAVYELLSRELGERLRHVAPVAPMAPSTAKNLYPRPYPARIPNAPAPLRERVGAAVSARVSPNQRSAHHAATIVHPRAAVTASMPLPSAVVSRTPFYSQLRYVAQTSASYILCEGDDALYLLDPRAMRERVSARPGAAPAQVAAEAEALGARLAPSEVRSLLDALDACDFSLPCLHPRPVLFRIGHDELVRRAGGP